MKTTQNEKSFLLFRLGPYPIPNKILGEDLPKRFQGLTVRIVDIKKELKARPHILLINLIFTIIEYNKKLANQNFKIQNAFLGTSFLFWWIKKLARTKAKSGNIKFTFQTESMYDASIEGIPNFVYTDHTHLANILYPDFEQNKLRPQIWIDLEKTIYKNATRILTRSTNISRSLIEQYGVPKEKIVRVGAGSNIKTIPKKTKSNYRNKNIIFVGIDWERKGGPDLVAAFNQIIKVHPDASLTIVGCSPKITAKNCTTTGRIPIEEVEKYYEQASIFCMPTKIEPFGVVFLEALYYKLPVVATNVGAIPDFIKEGITGYTVFPGDINGLASKLIFLLDHPDLCKNMGEEGHKLVTEFYSWDKVTEKIANIIQDKIIEQD